MDRNSNSYTFIFSIIMVIVVGSGLAYTATSLKGLQDKNVLEEKMQNILATIGIQTERADAPAKYEQYIQEAIVLNHNGEVVEGVEAFAVDLNKEMDKPVEEQAFPLYVADVDGEKYYIIPLYGSGLWDAIWGYVSLKEDVNTIAGASFGHKAETPGLGAEITKEYFTKRFVDEKVMDESGNMIGVSVVKGYTGGNDKDDSKVDIISGATITSVGVSDMISERLKHYLPYFEKQGNVKVANN